MKRALVTGASAGIGRACAEELHAAGSTRLSLAPAGAWPAPSGGPAGQAAAAVPRLRSRGQEQPGSLMTLITGLPRE
jgi:NAD(P)-dependent dehydrogenase (short-subunit alcohol dehydrogenase family)